MADPKGVVERQLGAFNSHDVHALPFSASMRLEAPGARLDGREQAHAFLLGFWAGFPDARLHLSRLIAEGTTVAAEGTFRGTHTGPLGRPQGEIPPTGRSVTFSWLSMYEVRDGELAAEHLIFDRADLMEQLGLAGEAKR